jgi:hypothetical protein
MSASAQFLDDTETNGLEFAGKSDINGDEVSKGFKGARLI